MKAGRRDAQGEDEYFLRWHWWGQVSPSHKPLAGLRQGSSGGNTLCLLTTSWSVIHTVEKFKRRTKGTQSCVVKACWRTESPVVLTHRKHGGSFVHTPADPFLWQHSLAKFFAYLSSSAEEEGGHRPYLTQFALCRFRMYASIDGKKSQMIKTRMYHPGSYVGNTYLVQFLRIPYRLHQKVAHTLLQVSLSWK